MMQMGRLCQVMRFSDVFFVCLGLLAAPLASCEKRSEIKVYRVSKAPLEEAASTQMDAMPTNAGSPAAPAGMAPAASTAAVTTPPAWELQPLSQMRGASFLVKGESSAIVDISLVSLGASAGNVLDNVNRWLDQLGQPPISQEKLTEIAQRLTTSLGEVTIVDLAGLPKDADAAKDGRIIAAIAPTNSSVFFFKMRGNDALTEAQKSDFIKWVAGVCNAQTEEKSPQTPEGWAEGAPSSMRYASFSASGENGKKIDISIVTFSGDGGSDADNVNRWRRQIGLPPIDDKGVATLITPLNAGGTDFSALDMTAGDSRVIAAWTRRDGRSWFFKMSGPAPLLEREKPKFFDFLRSVEFSS
jgi:hypothetical protein